MTEVTDNSCFRCWKLNLAFTCSIHRSLSHCHKLSSILSSSEKYLSRYYSWWSVCNKGHFSVWDSQNIKSGREGGEIGFWKRKLLLQTFFKQKVNDRCCVARSAIMTDEIVCGRPTFKDTIDLFLCISWPLKACEEFCKCDGPRYDPQLGPSAAPLYPGGRVNVSPSDIC